MWYKRLRFAPVRPASIPRPNISSMKNFLRVVRLTLQRRMTFALAVLCSIGVAVLWGANLGMIKPVVEIVFSEKPPHAWADARVEEAALKAKASREALAAFDAKRAQLPAAERAHLRGRGPLENKLSMHEQQLKTAQYMRPLVKNYLPNDAFQTLALFVFLLVVATLIKDALLVSNLVLVERMTQLAMFEMRKKIFRKTLKMEVARFGEDHSSHMLHRLMNDVNCSFNGVNILIGRLILEPLKMVACFVGAAIICWRLLIVSLLIAPLAAYIMIRMTQALKQANRKAMDQMGDLYTVISETYSGIHSVKAFGMERHQRRQFHIGGKHYFGRAMRIIFFNGMARGSAEFMGIATISLAIVAGAYLVLNQRTDLFGVRIMDQPLSLGALMAFYALLAGVSDPARKLSEVMNTLQRGIVASDRIFESLDREPTIVDPPEPKTITNPRPDLVFEDVSFHYRRSQPVLEGVDLRIKFGETVAIVGPNGCGKTTLASLLLRFYDPVKGAVKLDGIDLRDLRLRDLRRMTGLVAQQATLFDDTVMNNIRFGSSQATDDEVIAAAEKAYAHRFIIDKLEKGYETEVGERGGKLSGGQRQRILLARAILRDPKFLILDEATSQIDLESEQLIHKVLEQFIRGRTTLMITHRMSSIVLADRVVVMEAGQIIDVGTHDELASRCDLYGRLCHLGFKQTA